MSVSALFTGGCIDDPSDVTVTQPLIDQAVQATAADEDSLTVTVEDVTNITAVFTCGD